MSDEQRLASGSFEIVSNLSDKRQLKVSGYIYSDDTAAEVNKRVDEYQDVVDRQVIRLDLLNKEAQIATNLAGLEQLKDHVGDIAAKKTSGKKLHAQEIQQLNHFDATTKNILRNNNSLRAAIDEGKRKLNGAA